MDAAGALVSYGVGRSHGGVANPSLVSSSGIKFGRWVLAHGSLVSPLKAATKILKAQQSGRNIRTDDAYRALPEVYVSYEQTTSVPALASPADCASRLTDGGNRGVRNTVAVSRGKIKFMWKCDLLSDIADTVFCNWTIGHEQADRDDQDDSAKYFLSVFVLIDIGDPSKVPSLRKPLKELLTSLPSHAPRRGEEVRLRGTPFGSEVFLNSLTVGVACSCLGPGPSLLLCDASSVLGCEGGPAYMRVGSSSSDSRLFGMVLNSLSWCRGEWVGLTLVASLAPSLHLLLHPEEVRIPREVFADPRELPVLSITDIIDRTVVLIKDRESWGSALSLGNGYFLTCSHVVKYHGSQELVVYCLGKSARAKMLFRTPDNSAYDLAVIYAAEFASFPPLEISSKPAVKGETVIAVGFPYFSEKHIKDIRPTITKGSVTNSSPHMLQSSCCVQSGCSGGGILRVSRTGEGLRCELLGLVVCNTRNESNNTKFPNVNMAVPAAVFRKPLITFMDDLTLSTLQDFEEKQEHIQSLWKLHPISNL